MPVPRASIIVICGVAATCLQLGQAWALEAGGAPALVRDSQVHSHSCAFTGDSDSPAGFVDESLYILTNLRVSVVATIGGNPIIDNRIYDVTCMVQKLEPFVDSSSPAVAELASRWTRAARAIQGYLESQKGNFPTDFRAMMKSDPTKADAYWKSFIKPTTHNIHEITLVLRDLRKAVSSGALVVDSRNRELIASRHWSAYCDAAWLAEFHISADDPWTREACALICSLSGTESCPEHADVPAGASGKDPDQSDGRRETD